MPKSKILVVRIMARSDFGSWGFHEHGTKPNVRFSTVKTQLTEDQTTFLWAFGFQMIKNVRNPNPLELGQIKMSENQTSSDFSIPL